MIVQYNFSAIEATRACIFEVEALCSSGFYFQLSHSFGMAVNLTMGVCDLPVCYEETALTCVAELEVEVLAALAVGTTGGGLLPIPLPGSAISPWVDVCR